MYLIPSNHGPLQIHPVHVKTQHTWSYNTGWNCLLCKWTLTESQEMPKGVGHSGGVREDAKQAEILFPQQCHPKC